MNVEHPKREDFPSDVTYWAACMHALAAAYPAEWARAAAWRRMDPEYVVARIRELFALERDEWTDENEREWLALAAAYRSQSSSRRKVRQ